MFKIWKNKKAVNDVSILASILSIFIVTGALLPYINEGFGQTSTEQNLNQLENDISDSMRDTNTINAYDIMFSIFSMFFWSFGALPFWLDSFFLILRIIFGILLYRQIRSGGG